MKEIAGTAESLTTHPRTDGSLVVGADVACEDGSTVHVDLVIPAHPASLLIERLTYDARYHQPTTSPLRAVA